MSITRDQRLLDTGHSMLFAGDALRAFGAGHDSALAP